MKTLHIQRMILRTCIVSFYFLPSHARTADVAVPAIQSPTEPSIAETEPSTDIWLVHYSSGSIAFYEFKQKQKENSSVSIYVVRCSWKTCLNVRNGLLVSSNTEEYPSSNGWSMVTTANENNFIHDGKNYYNLYFQPQDHQMNVILKYSRGLYTGVGYLVEEVEIWKVNYTSGSVAVYQFNRIGSKTFAYILECSWYSSCYSNRGNFMTPSQSSETPLNEDWQVVSLHKKYKAYFKKIGKKYEVKLVYSSGKTYIGTGVGYACFENKCRNEGGCYGDEKTYRCKCVDGWQGRFCRLKEWEKQVLIKSERPIAKGKPIASLPRLSKIFKIVLEFFPDGMENQPEIYRNVMRFTTVGVDNRIPAVYFNTRGMIKVVSHVNRDPRFQKVIDGVELNKWHNLEIKQELEGSAYYHYILLNGEVVSRVLNTEPKVFQNVRVFATTKGSISQEGKIRKLAVYSPVEYSYEYWFVQRQVTWNEASQECNDWGGNLATVASQQQNDDIVSELKKREIESVWIGLTDESKEGEFVWANGGVDTKFRNWRSSGRREPNGGTSENCVELIPGVKYSDFDWQGTWNDLPCNSKNSFVCQKKHGSKEDTSVASHTCAFTISDGTGAEKVKIGHQRGDDCINASIQHRENNTSINGVTVYSSDWKMSYGWCLTCGGVDQNSETIKLIGITSEIECLRKCKFHSNSKGCEYTSSICIVHTQEVSKGSGNADYKCWSALTNCQTTIYAIEAWSSSIYSDGSDSRSKYGPQLAWEGGSKSDNGFFRSQEEEDPWLQIQLNEPFNVTSVTVINHPDYAVTGLRNLYVRAGLENSLKNELVGVLKVPVDNTDVNTVKFTRSVLSQFLTFQMKTVSGTLEINGIRLNREPALDQPRIVIQAALQRTTLNVSGEVHDANMAVDGDYSTFSVTAGRSSDPFGEWWQGELQVPVFIGVVHLYLNNYAFKEGLYHDMKLEVRKEENDNWKICNEVEVNGPINPHRVTCTQKRAAKWIKISIPKGKKLYLNEVEVYGSPIDEDWSSWSSWYPCSVSCGNGTKERMRECKGSDCQTIFEEEIESCTGSQEYCPGFFATTSLCKEVCNFYDLNCDTVGNMYREDVIQNLESGCRLKVATQPISYNDCYGYYDLKNSTCPNGVLVHGLCYCTTKAEQVSGIWSEWGECSTSCGIGKHTRIRRNVGTNIQVDDLKDDLKEIKACGEDRPCPVDGGWSKWSLWSPCNSTCDMGVQHRVRECTNPTPRHEGDPCIGTDIDTRSCPQDEEQITLCPVHGGWSNWTPWTVCDKPCGGGIKRRLRTCDQPRPELGGRSCMRNNGTEGDEEEERISCNTDSPCVPVSTNLQLELHNLRQPVKTKEQVEEAIREQIAHLYKTKPELRKRYEENPNFFRIEVHNFESIASDDLN